MRRRRRRGYSKPIRAITIEDQQLAMGLLTLLHTNDVAAASDYLDGVDRDALLGALLATSVWQLATLKVLGRDGVSVEGYLQYIGLGIAEGRYGS